jgi:ankyrin repeat protein
MLLDHGADVNETFASLQTTALMTSSFHGHDKIVRTLLGRGANPKAVDMQGSTALGYAFGGLLYCQPNS